MAEIFFTKRRTLELLQRLDEDLEREGYQRKISLYSMGGTKMVLSGLRHSTVDIDFLISREDFRVLGFYVFELDRKYKIRLDLFPEGQFPGYVYSDFKDNAYVSHYRFKRLDLYFIDDIDFVITKALAWRRKDREDLESLFSIRKIPKQQILERLQKVKFDPDKEEALKKNFNEFLREFYQS